MKIILTLAFAFCFCYTHAQNDTLKTDTSVIVIYKNPEIQAEYPGGMGQWFRYLSKHLVYPDKAVVGNIQGIVVTRFIVDSAGYAHHFISVSGPEDLQDAAMKLLKTVQIWVPATNAGKNVNSWKEQPIGFKLSDH